MSFDFFGLHAQIMAGVAKAGYTVPTPIQNKAIPVVLEGRDLVGLAQTGTGKTAAFVLPILQRLIEEKQFERINRATPAPAMAARRPGPGGNIPLAPIRALVLAPTRELARQIHDSFLVLGGPSGCRAAAIYGGVGMNPQIGALRRGVDVVVACPGRLLDLMNQGFVDLSRVQVLVLDEADHMFDMGFLPDVRRILKAVPAQRQTLLFSATMPQEIQQLADEVLVEPMRVALANTRPAATISQGVYQVPGDRKAELLEALLKTDEVTSAIIFTRTKHRAKSLAAKLERKGFKATSLQGNLSQNQRERAMAGFRSGDYTIMVATDIAARGLDCEGVSHVVNFDLPDTVECYTHRVGRTGRAEKAGRALTLAGREDQSMLRAIERTLGVRLERCMLEGFDCQAPAEEWLIERPALERRPQRQGQGRGGQGGGRKERGGQGRVASGREQGQPKPYRADRQGDGAESRGQHPRASIFGLPTGGRGHGNGSGNGGRAGQARGEQAPRPAAPLAFQPKRQDGPQGEGQGDGQGQPKGRRPRRRSGPRRDGVDAPR